MNQRVLGRVLWRLQAAWRAPGCLQGGAALLSLALWGVPLSAQSFTLTTTPSEAPAVQTQMVGQAALEETIAQGEGASLQFSDALSVHPRASEPRPHWRQVAVTGIQGVLLAILGLWALLTLRQWLLTMNRVSDRSREPYAGIVEGGWPKLSVVVLAHNSQALVGEALDALCQADYPASQWQIVAVNDRSTDRTRQIMDERASRHAGRMVTVHRNHGLMGRGACLLSAMPHVDGEFLLVLDAEHRVGPALLKQLMAPFFDPEVGSVSGRAMPLNVQANWMTRLADLGLSAHHQVDQQARSNLGLMPQPEGLVVWRRSALVAACAASSDAMADAVDVAHRLGLRGWRQVHQGQVDAHIVVPQTWALWREHIFQQASARQGAAARHLWPWLTSPHLSASQKLDGLLCLAQVFLPAWLVLSGACVLALHLMGEPQAVSWGLAVLALAACGGMAGSMPQVQCLVGARLDGRHRAVRLLPMQFLLGLAGLLTQAAQSATSVVRALRWLGVWAKRSPVRARRTAKPDAGGPAPGTVVWAHESEAA